MYNKELKQKKIQELLDSLERFDIHTIRVDDMDVMLTYEWTGDRTMYCIIVNKVPIHRTSKKSSIKNILMEWKNGTRELRMLEYYGLLLKQ